MKIFLIHKSLVQILAILKYRKTFNNNNKNYIIYFIYQDEELARQLVELGYRGSGEVIKREEFYARKAAAEQQLLSRRIQAPYIYPKDHFKVLNYQYFLFYRKLASANKEITEPLLRELADTEEANRTGKMTVSHFIYSLSE